MKDSRPYRFPYLIGSREDFPEDFPPLSEATLLPALFLPRDDPDWLGRSANPPRVVSTTEHALNIHYHPESSKEPQSLPMGTDLSIQAGRSLLIGWIGFASGDADVRLPFNRRVDRPVREFLGALRARLFRPAPVEDAERLICGDALDIKFRNALDDEIDPGEAELVRLFVAPRRQHEGRWIFRTARWAPGDILALTDRRVIWITERRRGGFREIYGAATSCVDPAGLIRIELNCEAGRYWVSAVLRNGKTWNIDIPEGLAGQANEAVSAICRASSGLKNPGKRALNAPWTS